MARPEEARVWSRAMCYVPSPDDGAGGDYGLEQVTLSSGGDPVPAWLGLPPGEGRVPGIVVLSDMFGPTAFYHHFASDLRAEGYAVLLPDMYSRMEPLPEVTIPAARDRLERMPDREAEQDVNAAIDYLKGHPRVQADRIGTIGFCMGGTWALLMSALRDDLRAGVCLYGFPVQREKAPWKIYEPVALVERYSHPVLGLWGDLDNSVPMEHVEKLRTELERHGKPHEIVVYPGADHSFMVPQGWHIPGRNNPPGVAEDAWARILGFFATHLRAEARSPAAPA
jgi:carboxymethylenebutenolidase